MLESTALRLLQRYGLPCLIQETVTVRTSTGGVNTTVTTHSGIGYKQANMKDVDGLNPSTSAKLLIQTNDGYIVKPKDKIVLNAKTEQALNVHVITVPSGVLYQAVEV